MIPEIKHAYMYKPNRQRESVDDINIKAKTNDKCDKLFTTHVKSKSHDIRYTDTECPDAQLPHTQPETLKQLICHCQEIECELKYPITFQTCVHMLIKLARLMIVKLFIIALVHHSEKINDLTQISHCPTIAQRRTLF